MPALGTHIARGALAASRATGQVAGCLALLLGAAPLGAQQSSKPPVEDARLVSTLDLDGTVYHVQGVDLDNDHIWLTSVDLQNHRGYLHVFDRATGRLQRQVEVTDGPRYHPGGISLAGDAIWVPVAELKPDSSAVLEEIDKRTLQVRRRIALADHLGCVALTGREIVAGNWDSRTFYVFSRRSGALVRKVPNPYSTRYQDIKFAGGRLVASGQLGALDGTIDWIDWPSMRRQRSLRAGGTDRAKPYTGEGMALKGRNLFLVSEDGPSRMFHFRLST